MRAHRLTFAASLVTAFFATGSLLATISPAGAQDCNAEVGVLMKKRTDLMAALNDIAKANKGKLDPIAGCVKLKALVGADKEILAYFNKNKEWCSIPDEATNSMSADVEKTSTVATQACTIAEKMKKAQEQQAAGGGALGGQVQKLPAGPL